MNFETGSFLLRGYDKRGILEIKRRSLGSMG